MPNHVTNRLTVTGETEEVKKLFNHIKGIYDDGTDRKIDFNKILPMPESLNIVSGSLPEMAHRLLFGGSKSKYFINNAEDDQKRFSELSIDDQKEAAIGAIQYQDNFVKYGHTTWYSWCVDNWGTKWNAYGTGDKRDTENIIFFQTAWNAPIELISKLSEMFPKVRIELKYADEDSGSNTGRFVFEGGEQKTGIIYPGQSKEAYENCFEVNPGDREYYQLVNGRYEYKEEE